MTTTIRTPLRRRPFRIAAAVAAVGALIALAALFVSPLGYLLIDPIGQLTGRAAGSLF